MKKLFCIVLVFVMLLSLVPLAFASEEAGAAEELAEAPAELAEEVVGEPAEEIPVDEPIDEPAGEPEEEPAEPAPEPAGDGAIEPIYLNGQVRASQFSDLTPLGIVSNSVMIVDKDLTVPYIDGLSRHVLTIHLMDGHTLTIVNSDGHGISCNSLSVKGSGTLRINATRDALNINSTVFIGGNAVLELTAGWDGIFSRTSSVTLQENAKITITAGEDAIDCKGDLKIESGVTFNGWGKSGYGIYVRDGAATLAGNVTASGKTQALRIGGYFSFPNTVGIAFPSGGRIGEADGYATVLDANGTVAPGVIIGKLGPLTGTVRIKGESMHPGDKLELTITNYPAATQAIQWQYSSDNKTWYDIPSANGGSGSYYTAKASDARTYIRAMVTALNYTGAIYSDARYINPISLSRVDFTSLETELTAGKEIPNKSAVLASGSHCTAPIYYWEDARGDISTGIPVENKYYWLNVYIEPEAGYTFGPAGTAIAVYRNGTKLGDGTVENNVYGRDEMLHFTLRRTGPATGPTYTLLTSASITMTEPVAGAPVELSGVDGTAAPGSHFTVYADGWYTRENYNFPAEGSFEAGKTYYYYALLKPDDGYRFKGPSNGQVGQIDSSVVAVKANGTDASYILWFQGGIPQYDVANATGWLQVYIPFTVPSPSYSGDIALTGFTPPSAGAQAKADAKLSGSGCEIAEQGWYRNVTATTPITTFEAGGLCVYTCLIQPTGGAKLARNGLAYAGTVSLNGETLPYKSATQITKELQEGATTIKGYFMTNDTTLGIVYIRQLPDAPAANPTVTLSADAKSAQATDFAGLYARVALVLDNGGKSGLYVTQVPINSSGEIVIPGFTVPGLTVKGINIALVPTLSDISSAQPTVMASDFKML